VRYESPKALINPKMLAWMRVQGNYTLEDMARKARTTEEKYAAWESGEAQPTIVQLQHLAHGLRRAVSLFYFSDIPEPEPALPDFRSLPSGRKELSSDALLEIRLARERQREFEEIAEQPDSDIKPCSFAGSATLKTPVPELAARAKDLLGVQWPAANPLPSGYAVFNFWRAAFERSGVLVFQCTVELDEFRAAAIVETQFPAVLISSKDYIFARVFSLLHELGHVLLGQSNLSLVTDEGQASEKYCNQFAAEMLMPGSVFRHDPAVSKLTSRNITAGELTGLSRRFGVSRLAAAMRLVDLDIQNRSILPFLARTLANDSESASGGGNYYSNQVSHLGPLLIQTTLQAMDRDAITVMDAYRILGVKPSYLETLRLAVGT
jgi:Zn-dependent peptidase ImmA (M78 family)